jgi:peptidyl-prolyl cis-trans isomerase A (cyclophilin A)
MNIMKMKIIALLLMCSFIISCKPEGTVTQTLQTQEQKMEPIKPNTDALSNPGIVKEKSPEKFNVRFKTTKGDFVFEITRAWSPSGADRFYNLVKIGYWTDIAFFRVVPNFVVQFGIHGNPQISAKWRAANISDDSVTQSNLKGYLTYATAGPNTRTTQLFINLKDNSNLDSMGFSPVGKVIEGMDVVEKLYSGYGDGVPYGQGPDQARIQAEGNAYLKSGFPNLDYIIGANLE